MSTSVTFNGASFTVPSVGDAIWGTNVSNYLIAISTGCLQKSGGAFTLTAEVDFGATYALKMAYIKSRTANIAAAGFARLANTDTISWRNGANSADLPLDVSSDMVRFNSIELVNLSATQTLTNKSMDGNNNTFTNLPASGITGTVPANRGGTGVSNNVASTITISGAFGLTLTLSALTSLTLPTSGTLATVFGAETLTNKTMSGSFNTFLNLPASALTGNVSPANGGTGVSNNASSTITISGAFGLTFTLTALTALTLPTTGTLATLAGSETFTNKTLTAANVTGGSYINLLTQAAIRFNDDAGGDYIALQAPTGVTTYTIKLPATQGAASTTLNNDGAGNLTWVAGVSAGLNEFNVDIGNSANTRTATNSALLGDIKGTSVSQTYAVTAAAPGVFTVATAPETGAKAYVTVTQNGFTANTTYYVTKVSGTTFKLATTLANAIAGTNITSSGTTAGTIVSGGLNFATGRLAAVTSETTLPSVTWTNSAGTNPSTVTSSGYKWTQNGNIVTLWWRILYTNAGNALTNAYFQLPTDLPTPVQWTAGGAAGYEYWGNSMLAASGIGAQTLPPGLTYLNYNDDVASTWTVHYVAAASGSNIKFWGGQIQYHTA